MADKAKIKAAEKATDAAEDQWAAIYKAVHAPRWTNGAGVYTDRLAIKARLMEIRQAADSAYKALDVPWPSDEDYDD
jgi:hypothetical protein